MKEYHDGACIEPPGSDPPGSDPNKVSAQPWGKPTKDPLPESAVELAARAVGDVGVGGLPLDMFATPDELRAIVRAALPAIREAVVGEFKGLVAELLTHREGDLPTRGWLRDNDASRAVLGKLAALTEQENRNG